MTPAEQMMKSLVQLTPEEQAADESDSAQQLQAELDRTTDPARRSILLAEVNRMTGRNFDTGASSSPTSSSRTTRTTLQVPGMPLPEYQRHMESYITSNRAITAQLMAALTGASVAGNDAASAAIKSGEATADAARAVGAQQEEKANQDQAAIDLFRAATGDPDGAIVQAVKRRTEATGVMNTLRPRIDAEDQVTVFDDPLRWAVNQFTLPKLKRAYNAAFYADQKANQDINQIQAQVQQQKVIDSTPSLTLIRQHSAALAQKATFDALVTARKLQQDSSHYIAQGLQAQLASAGAELGAITTFAKLFAESQTLSASSREEGAVQQTLDAINMKRATYGAAPYSMTEFKLLTGKERSELISNAKLPGLVYGTDLGDSFKYLHSQGALATMTERNPAVAQFLGQQVNSDAYKQTLTELQRDTKNAGLSYEDLQAKALTLRSEAQYREIAKQGSPVNKTTADNPYRFKIGTAVQYADLQDNEITKIVKGELVRTGAQQIIEDKELLAQVLGRALAQPERVPELAQSLSDFYRKGTIAQWQQGGAAVLGYPKPREYVVSGLFTQDTTDRALQLWSPAEVQHWLTQNLVYARLQEAPLLFNVLGDAP